MEKIGLVISIAIDGKQEAYSSKHSSSDWSRMVIDLREEVKSLSGYDNDNPLTRLSFVENGALITIIAPVTGRGGDYKSAWIYFPAAASVSGKEMIEVVDFVKQQIHGFKIDEGTLDQFFAKEYPTRTTHITPSVPSNKSGLAYRYYGPGTLYELYEILGDNIFQSYYYNYTAVYLLSKESHAVCAAGTDLSNEKIKSVIIVEPPINNDGFIPKINDKPFIQPIAVMEGDSVFIQWTKENYKTIEKRWTACKETSVPRIMREEYIRMVPKYTLIVRDKKGKSIQNIKISFHDNVAEREHYYEVPESVVRSCKIMLSATGYNDRQVTCDLTKAVEITLDNLQYTYLFKLPVQGDFKGKDWDYSIKTDDEINSSPFEGYKIKNQISVKDHEYTVFLEPIDNKTQVSFLAKILIILALLLGWCGGAAVAFYSERPAKQQTTPPKGKQKTASFDGTQNSPTAQAETENESEQEQLQKQKAAEEQKEMEIKQREQIRQAVEYLNNNKWKKDEMDEIPLLYGLWDEINEYRFQDILSRNEQLKESDNFNSLVAAIQKKGINSYGNGAKYNKPNDKTITLKVYIDKLNGKANKTQNTEPVKQSGITDNQDDY